MTILYIYLLQPSTWFKNKNMIVLSAGILENKATMTMEINLSLVLTFLRLKSLTVDDNLVVEMRIRNNNFVI